MKLADFQKQMADGNLELLWAYEANGYSSTVYHKNGKETIKLHSGSINI